MHGHQNIRATNELVVHVKLRDRRPVRVLLDTFRLSARVLPRINFRASPRTLSKLLILQNIERSEFLRVHALQAKYLYARY